MGKKTAEEAYSIIYDNSITVCGQVLHLELKSSSEHPGHSLRHADVSVLRMKVGKGWDAEMINGQLENVYSKDPEFMDFIVKKGNARKFSHTPMAGLMPPRRREYARFMNVFDTVHRAKAILENDRLLSGHERYIHQTTTIPVRLRQPLHCLLSLFYIKPQPASSDSYDLPIVFYLILHQTTTHVALLFVPSDCLLSLFYIKPQPGACPYIPPSNCLLSLFYIKPQQRARLFIAMRYCLLSLFYIKPQRTR